MTLKNCLVGIDFEKRVLLFTAGEGINGILHLKGGSQGTKLYELKLTLIRRSDYVFVPTALDRLQSLNHLVSTYRIGSSGHSRQETVTSSTIPPDGAVTNLAPNSKTSLRFSLPLPDSLWSSFATPNAFTWYALQLSGKAASHYAKREVLILKKDVVILGNVAVDQIPHPFSQVVHHNAADGAVSKMKVTLPSTAGAAGDRLPFVVNTLNAGPSGIGGVRAILTQNIGYSFMARHRRHMKTSWTKVLWEDEGPPTGPGGTSSSWKGELPLPFTVPSNLGAEPCPNISCSYSLTFSLSGNVKLLVRVEIMVGTRRKRGEEGGGGGDEEEEEEGYWSEISKELSESQYSLDWESTSLSSEDSGVCWTICEDTASTSSQR